MFCALLFTLAARISAEMVQNWKATLQTPAKASFYKMVFEWDHNADEAVVIGFGSGLNPIDDPRCSGSSTENAADGQPYWMPRFFPRPVSKEITAQTGVQFISVDWQPCGHKDITICHGESHYDIHLYYAPEADMNALKVCDIGTKANPHLPVCTDSKNPINHAYFKLINQNMPTKANITLDSRSLSTKTEKTFDFCVDPSSAILRSGVHYGDKSETLDEWKTPVTIIGSHDCQLKFFEPMVSWKWISGEAPGNTWPTFQVSDIQYNNKTYDALPHHWGINVSEGCKNATLGACHIDVTVEGTKCPPGGCILTRECGSMKNCKTGKDFLGATSASASALISRARFFHLGLYLFVSLCLQCLRA